MIASVGCIIKLKREPPFSVGNWQQIHERIKMVKTLISSQALQPNLRITQMLLQTCLPSDALALFKLVWLVLLAQVRTHYKIGKLNLWTLFCNVYINFWAAKYERKSCLNWMISLQVLPCSQLIFPSKTGFFGIYSNFQWQKSLENQYLSHSESKSYQINSIKSYSSRSSQ